MRQIDKEETQVEHSKNSETMLERLTEYAASCEKKGLFPYDGQWLSTDEIDNQIRRKQSKSRIQLLELGSLFALVHVYAILMWLLLSRLIY